MPPSRIAFAVGDLVQEVRRLLPADKAAMCSLVLDDDTYAKVGRELAEYANAKSFDPMSAFFTFAGLKVMREGANE